MTREQEIADLADKLEHEFAAEHGDKPTTASFADEAELSLRAKKTEEQENNQ